MRFDRACVLTLFAAAVSFAGAPLAADWLVYQGGGVEEVRGGWKVQRGQVVFTAANGTLQSARVDDVDLAASAFLTWQVGERRGVSASHPPAGTEMRRGGAAASGASGAARETPCATAELVAVGDAETLELAVAGKKETVHLACVDAPGRDHRFPEISRLGIDAFLQIELLARPGFKVCVTEEIPALVDREGHRVVYLRLPDGRDLGAELIARGLALARSGGCAREKSYVALESRAIADFAGHWDDRNSALVTVLANATAVGGGGGGGVAPQRTIRRS